MKANRKQTAVKLTASKIGTHVMVRVVTKYGKKSTYADVRIKRAFGEISWYGMEISCVYNFVGPRKHVDLLEQLLDVSRNERRIILVQLAASKQSQRRLRAMTATNIISSLVQTNVEDIVTRAKGFR